MTISCDFNSFVMAGLVPAIHALAGIPLIARHGVFFCILLMGESYSAARAASSSLRRQPASSSQLSASMNWAQRR
jgi:hypothetical protein